MEDVNISKFRAQVVRAGSTPANPGFVVSEGQDPVNPSGSSIYVPYSGAISNVDFGEFGLDTGFVTLDTTPTNIPTEQGGIYWDDARSTAALIMNGTLQHIGQDTFFYVKNSTGSSIAKGTAVRFDGTNGASGHLLIAPFLADGTYPSSYFMGVTAEEILNGEFGQVMHFGELQGVNTSSFTAGALLYASTTVAGAFQTTAPVAPNNIVLIAAAINSTNNGAILVRPSYGSNINQDEGVKITSVANLNLLQYQSGTGLWENKSVATVMSNYVTLDGTQTISGAKTFTTATKFDAYIRLKHDINLDHISGYSTIGSDANNFFLAASSSKYAVLNVGNLTSQQTYTFPNVSGTIALVGGAGVGTVTSVAALTLGTSGTDLSSTVANGTTTPVITLNVPTASASNRGALSAADWTTFNGKQNALTNPVTGTGTTNYLPKFTGASTIGNSIVFDNGTNVGIGTTAPTMPIANRNGLVIRGGSNGAEFNLQSTSATDGTSVGFALVAFSTDAYYINRLDGNHIWATGSGGNTERMRIWGSSGNVNIGPTPASDNGQKLQVSGQGIFTDSANGFNIDLVKTGGFGACIQLKNTSGLSIDLIRVLDSSNNIISRIEPATGGINFAAGNVGIGHINPGVRLVNSGAANTSVPTLGSATVGSNAILSNNGLYGLYTGVSDEGHVWLQVQRNDGNTSTYPLVLQPSGSNVLIGTTTDAGSKLRVNQGGVAWAQIIDHSNAAAQFYIDFRYNGIGTGSIIGYGTFTNYNTTSDYRLKEDLRKVNGLEKINAINIYNYKWKESETRMDGVLAHELAEVLPYAVSGQKDGEQMQGVDYSKIVPLLIQSIQELKQEIDTLKN
jgi:hypothetical protein